MAVTITKKSVEVYQIRFTNENGYRTWADITLDVCENAGRISIASDYGDWQHYWGSCGVDFKTFLGQIDMHYAAGKFGMGKWFDHAATMADLRRQIDECDEEDEVKEEMRSELEIHLEDCTDVTSWMHQAYICDELRKLWDCGPDIQYDVDPHFRRFWEELWPHFIAEIKKEVV